MEKKDFEKLINEVDPAPQTSGRKVRAVRKFLGFTLKDLEDITGISQTNLSALENDRLEMTKKSAEMIGAALGIHPMDILYPEGHFNKDARIKRIEKRALAMKKKRVG
ncbi:Helix-turn-helix domain protein [compost metagenome]